MSRIERETWYIVTEDDTSESFWDSIPDGEVVIEASRLYETKGPGFHHCEESDHGNCTHGKVPLSVLRAVRVIEDDP